MRMQPSRFLVKRFSSMLKIFNNLGDIDFRQLMNVYTEGNRINGSEFYSKYPDNLRILYAEQDFYNYLLLFFKEKTARYAVWEHEGCYVAALRIERFSDGLLLSALETDPKHRRMGFASSLITATVEHLKTGGRGRLYSHVNKHNIASLAVHEKCGFQIISDHAVYLDGTVVTDSYTLSLEY